MKKVINFNALQKAGFNFDEDSSSYIYQHSEAGHAIVDSDGNISFKKMKKVYIFNLLVDLSESGIFKEPTKILKKLGWNITKEKRVDPQDGFEFTVKKFTKANALTGIQEIEIFADTVEIIKGKNLKFTIQEIQALSHEIQYRSDMSKDEEISEEISELAKSVEEIAANCDSDQVKFLLKSAYELIDEATEIT